MGAQVATIADFRDQAQRRCYAPSERGERDGQHVAKHEANGEEKLKESLMKMMKETGETKE